LIYQCEVCTRLADQYVRYIIHLDIGHPLGDLARAVEPALLGSTAIDESPPKHPRVWDRWDRGGKSGPPVRTICPGPWDANASCHRERQRS
jgi:hypothetical protein